MWSRGRTGSANACLRSMYLRLVRVH
jgi:hypothetical protein